MTRLRSKTGYDDWIIYTALLPSLLTLVGLGVTAVLAWHNLLLRNAASPSASAIAGDAQDYVQGLAKYDIVKRPAPSVRRLWISFMVLKRLRQQTPPLLPQYNRD